MAETTQPLLSLSQQLGMTLVSKGLLSLDQLDVALKEQRLQAISFEECLLNLGLISEGALTEALSSTSGYDKINLKQALLDSSLKTVISKEIAEQFSLIPLSLENGILRVAMADIYNLEALDYLHHQIPSLQDIVPLIAPESDIIEAIDYFYGYDLSIRGLLREIENTPLHSFNREDYVNPTVRLVNAILMDAIKLTASDIHFEPEGSFMRLRYRIDGILSQICTLHSTYWPAICVHIKVMSGMNIAETRRPQNGRITFYIGPREVDLRVASHPTIHGENIVIRILDKSKSLLKLDELGYSKEVMFQIKKVFQRPKGIFIITGPTGCGKTTSLYSMLSYMSTPKFNIMTLEEPVEYQLPLIRQSNVRDLGGMGFEEGVRSILRQDPDIILIGEIRDAGTAQMALRAAMTGHQVFSTLHTNDALGSINRLVDLGLTRSMLANHLSAIVAQRLIRKLCPNCKQERDMTPNEIAFFQLPTPRSLFSAQGCTSCRETGYKGRLAIAEILVFDQEMEECLSSLSSNLPLKSLAQKKGFVSMEQDARYRVLVGDTTTEEIMGSLYLEETK